MKKLLLAALIATTITHAAPREASNLPLPLYWLDMAVLRDLKAQADGDEWWRVRRIGATKSSTSPSVAERAAKFGAAADKLRYFAEHPSDSGEEDQYLWAFADAASAEAAFALLDSQGFAALPSGEKALGTPGEIDWDNAKNWDVVWQPNGFAVVMERRDDLLWQGSKLRSAMPAPAQQSHWQSTLDTLRAALPENAQALQASFFRKENGLRQGIIGVWEAMTEGKEDADKPSEEAVEVALVAKGGLPPYLGGVLIDAQHGDKAIFLIALAYPDCDAADKAQAALPARWETWREERAHKYLPIAAGNSIDTLQIRETAGDQYCYAVLRHVSASANPAEHPALRTVWQAFLLRDFNVINIDTGE
ncbi:MAG: hypothetical protein Q4D61_07195 [Cardiobacteriaceae bacterium]|nr:hypothetical protein [Cardiobacteriaceae bacterium]